MAPNFLFIVSRRQRTLYEYLKRYSVEGDVEVILDRRQDDAGSSRAPGSVGDRQTERRVADVTAQLMERGWAIVDRRVRKELAG